MDEAVFPMRINKYLAHKKITTRRGADELISAGLVFINGKRAALGSKVLESDTVDVKKGSKTTKLVYIAYNKPRGVLTHSAVRDEVDIKKALNIPGVFPVGRLDKDSRGLIILTNDGRITDRLLSPKYDHDKEYFVKTKNILRKTFKTNMEKGVEIEDDETRPCKVKIIGEKQFKVTLTEGKKHQIRRMCSALFQEVDELERIRILNIHLDGLPEGEYRYIEGEELKDFLVSLDLG